VAIEQKVDKLEEALMRLVYIQQKTEMELQSFKNEMKVFKDEMTDFKEWSKKNIDSLNRQWGNLANRMGTLVEDIFFPSMDQTIERNSPDKVEVLRSKKTSSLFKLFWSLDTLRIDRDGYDYRNVQCIQKDYLWLPVGFHIVHDTPTPLPNHFLRKQIQDSGSIQPAFLGRDILHRK